MSGYRSRSATNIQGMSYDAALYCKTNIGGYFFDGFMKTTHQRNLTITSNPIESGAAVVDHAYMQPASITMDIMMSNVHESLFPDQFHERYDRSVSAWSVLKTLQENRIPVSVMTRLELYNNMLIESITSEDDATTHNGLRATVTLREVPIARIKTVEISVADQTTLSTAMGNVEAQQTTEADMSILYRLLYGEPSIE